MIRRLLAVALVVACASCASTRDPYYENDGYYDDVGTAYPPPPSMTWRSSPSVELVVGTDVYGVVDPSIDYDMFRYGSTWYVHRGGYWYRARDYSGPFAVVDVRSVPRVVAVLPDRDWRREVRYADRNDRYERRTTGPRIVLRTQPRVRLIESDVYGVTDRDIDYAMFRYGSRWYVFQDGAWYRAGSYSGPWRSVSTSNVPRRVMRAFERHWSNDGRWRGDRVRDRDDGYYDGR